MLGLEDINALNIEASSKCVGNCRFCSRGQKVRRYDDVDITFEEFKLLPETLLKRLRRISFDGNFGDLCSNDEFVDIAAYARELNPKAPMGGHSNGSNQDESWWRDLGPSFKNGYVVFALDGLADTHRLHRRGTDFHKIIRNIKAFTEAGGAAHWQFILFEHNEHQVKEAEAIAEDIGCKRFFVLASRDYDEKMSAPQKTIVPIKRDIFNEYRDKLDSEEAEAMCKPAYKGSIYLAADGTVHPCCLAHCMYISEHNDGFRYIVPLIEKYHEEINFKTKPLEEILSGPYFQAVLKMSRKNKYCLTKCNEFKDIIRGDLVLHDRAFT